MPPATRSRWSTPETTVHLKAGGTFSWDAAADGPGVDHLLLVAGGIGINPLYSMLQAASRAPRETVPDLRRISLLYSAARPSELAFRGQLEELAAADDRVRLELRATRNAEPEEPWSG